MMEQAGNRSENMFRQTHFFARLDYLGVVNVPSSKCSLSPDVITHTMIYRESFHGLFIT